MTWDHPYPRHPCGLYFPGHDTHLIQVNLSFGDTGHPPIRGTVTDINDDGELRVKFEGKRNRRRYWYHDPARLAWCVGLNDGDVQLRSYDLLETKSNNGCLWVFYVAKPDSEFRGPCPGPGYRGPRGGFMFASPLS